MNSNKPPKIERLDTLKEGTHAGFLDLKNDLYKQKKQILELEWAARACDLKKTGLPSPPDDASIIEKRDRMVSSFLEKIDKAAIKGVTNN